MPLVVEAVNLLAVSLSSSVHGCPPEMWWVFTHRRYGLACVTRASSKKD